jgi:uncharacterized protein YdhG (YjbR/CyaY superfamily)
VDDAVQTYIDAIAPENRPLFDRVQQLIFEVHPDAEVVIAYQMPTYKVGGKSLNVGVWKHGVSLYGWDQVRNADFIKRHPKVHSGKGTIRLRPKDAETISDNEIRALVRGALGA